MIFVGQASFAFVTFSNMEKSGDFIVKNPFFSIEWSNTAFPSFFDIWNCFGDSSTQ